MRFPRRPAFAFLPLVALYLLMVLASPSSAPFSDSTRYIWFAENLARGYYSPRPDINLWNGPGYPFLLWPFAALGLPWGLAKIVNCFLMFGALVYFHAMLRSYVSPRAALVTSYVLGLWPPILRIVPELLTEVLSIFLVCGFAFHVSRLGCRGRKFWFHLSMAAFYMAYLSLTRVYYGYVILVCLVAFAGLYLWKRRPLLRAYAIVFGLGLVLCIPYLIYTYSLTGRVFYWSTSAGLSLYWMASPYKSDLGDWHLPSTVKGIPQLAKNHAEFFSEIGSLSQVEQDAALRRRALENIAHHPGAFLKNCLANIGRLLFNYPYAYNPQRPSTYLYALPGMLLVVASLLCIRPTIARRRQVPAEFLALLIFGAVAFGGSSLLSAFNRFFLPLLPIVLLWLCFVLTRFVKIEIAR